MKVVYITGWQRSGTTILDNVLGTQPGFFAAGELSHAWEAGEGQRLCGCGLPLSACPVWSTVLDRVTKRCAIENLTDVLELKQQLLRFRHLPSLLIPRIGRQFEPQLDRYAEILGATYQELSDVTGQKVIVDSSKNTGTCLALARLADVERFVVHIVRHPERVAESEADRPVWEGVDPAEYPPHRSAVESAALWFATNLTAEIMARKIASVTWLQLRYEDWVRAPREETEKIIAAVGETFDPTPFVDDHRVALGPNHTLAGNPGRFSRGVIRINPEGRNRTPLSPRQHLAVAALTLPLRRKYLYPSGRVGTAGGFDLSHIADGPFARYPPGRGNIRVPVTDRRSALAGLSLHAACKRRSVLAHRIIWTAVACFGPRVLPGERTRWNSPMPLESWNALVSQLRDSVGPFDGLAVYERPQASRLGAAMLLLSAGRPVALVKARPHREPIERELRVLTALRRRPTPSFEVPEPLTSGETAGWWWLALSPLPARPHRPLRRPAMKVITAELQDVLADVIDRDGVPQHWRPIHGDLTPWNLRRGAGGPWLLDWEDASWGPPGADATYYIATSAAIEGREPPPCDEEVVRFWQSRVESRPADSDMEFNVDLAQVLTAMEQ